MGVRYGLARCFVDVEPDVVAVRRGEQRAVKLSLDRVDGRPDCGLFFGRQLEVCLRVTTRDDQRVPGRDRVCVGQRDDERSLVKEQPVGEVIVCAASA